MRSGPFKIMGLPAYFIGPPVAAYEPSGRFRIVIDDRAGRIYGCVGAPILLRHLAEPRLGCGDGVVDLSARRPFSDKLSPPAIRAWGLACIPPATPRQTVRNDSDPRDMGFFGYRVCLRRSRRSLFAAARHDPHKSARLREVSDPHAAHVSPNSRFLSFRAPLGPAPSSPRAENRWSAGKAGPPGDGGCHRV